MFRFIKSKKTNIACILRAAAAATGILYACCLWAFAAPAGYVNRRLWLANEPDGQSPYVMYYINGTKQPSGTINWVDGRNSGKAIYLSGHGEYLDVDYTQLQIHTMTIAGWFYWKGAADGMDEESMYSQRLFTLAHSKDTWLSVMPHTRKTDVKGENGGILDGVYMAFSMGKGNEKVFYEFFNPAEEGKIHYGLPLNEWHHVALTMDGQWLRLYIDGQLWFERLLVLGVEEMRNNYLLIGGGIWNEPTFNGLVDDLAIYSFAMNKEQIKMLYLDTDPLEEGATLPSTSAPSLPSPPETTTRAPEKGDILCMPPWLFYLAIGLLAVFVILSVLLNALKPGSTKDDSGEGGENQ
ncbi:MAG TPA: LamG domain-containing protein [Clostridiales bacterium]|nr:LamG domain-containing protein [Clostridiales bacterium]